jgi:hypothetical protein
MLATLTDAPFDDPAWVFESKWDGFRMVAAIDDGAVTLYSRNGNYVSRWCREGLVDARRIAGGIWFVNTRSLRQYLAIREARKSALREELRENRRDEREHNQSGMRLA